MKKILLLGSEGYIGSVLQQSLREHGHDVNCVDNLMYAQSRPRTPKFRQLDVYDVMQYDDWIKQADIVILLAALVGEPICRDRLEECVHTHCRATHRLVSRMSPEQRLIYANSCSSYGSQKDLCDEETVINPLSNYASTKQVGEQLALTHLNTTAFRFATVFGLSPRMRFDLMVNSFALRMVKQGKFSVFEPHFKRNFVHIKDVVGAIQFAIDNKMLGVYNCGLPTANLTKMELAEFLRDRINPLLEIEVAEGHDNDCRDYWINSAKLLSRGFEFKYGLEEVDEVIGFIRNSELSFEELNKMGNI